MIPPLLLAPIDYEQYYATEEGHALQRFKALAVMLRRLESVGWLANRIRSINLIDWDWRTDPPEYNYGHVPMMAFSVDILDWYREYGAFLHLAPERATLARFFFGQSPRRDIISISFDLSGDQLFAVHRENAGVQAAHIHDSADCGLSFMPERVAIQVNVSRAAELCRPLNGFLQAFRREHPVADAQRCGHIISLTDAIGDLGEPVSRLVGGSENAKASQDAYRTLPSLSLEHMGSGLDLLRRPYPLGGGPREALSTKDLGVLLANLTVQAYLMPPALRQSAMVIVPGIAQIRQKSPILAGGFLIHYDPPTPNVELAEWLLLATVWAREKATFDLKQLARKEANTFLGLANWHDVRSTIQHSVIRPLRHVLRSVPLDLADPVAVAVRHAAQHAEQYCEDLSLLLDAFSSIQAPTEEEATTLLDAMGVARLLDTQSLGLRGCGSLPQLSFLPSNGVNAILRLPFRTLGYILHILIMNAMDAMASEGLELEVQQIHVSASLSHTDGISYCDLSVWNAGTQFNRPVIDQAGYRPYTTNPSTTGSGLGLYIVNTILGLAGARSLHGRFLQLENTTGPKGAKVTFGVLARRM